MGDIVLDYLTHQDEKTEKEASLEELLVPSPCDTCVLKAKCADKLLACKTFSLFVRKREKRHPALFATNGKDRKPTKKIYKEHFAHTGHLPFDIDADIRKRESEKHTSGKNDARSSSAAAKFCGVLG